MGARKKTAEEIEESVRRAVQAVQRLAVGGVAPRVRDYSLLRDAGPSVETLSKYGLRYSDVVKRAGLRPAALGPGGKVPAAVEEEVQHRFATAEPAAPATWPLFGIPTRRRLLEQRVIGEDADGVLVAVRYEEFFSLR